MLTNMKQMLADAAAAQKIVPGFNVFGYEDAKLVIEVAEALKAPALLMTNRDASQFMDLKCYGALYKEMAAASKTDVCIHLDHGKSIEEVARAIQAGYTSVMYDGSALPLEENIAMSKDIAVLCRACGVSLEVEVGCVAYSDPSIQVEERLSEKDEVLRMAREVAPDGIAVAVGNVHRMEEKKAVIDFDRLKAIQEACPVPLVIHGSSGIPEDQVERMLAYGIGKMNVGTELRMAFGNTLREYAEENRDVFDRIALFRKPMEAMKRTIEARYALLGWKREE